jgi:signal transduction histidine kinase
LFARPSPPCRLATEIEPILDQALLFLKREMAKARIEVSQHYWPCPFQVLADAQQMHQVFLNILLNALQAMPRGGTLTLRTIPEPTGPPWTGVRIEIADTGDGIPAKYLHQIFEPFFTTKEEGTGLGLSVSRRIIAAHGGELSVESTEGQGTRFMVRLPTRPPPCPPQAEARGADSARCRGRRRDA